MTFLKGKKVDDGVTEVPVLEESHMGLGLGFGPNGGSMVTKFPKTGPLTQNSQKNLYCARGQFSGVRVAKLKLGSDPREEESIGRTLRRGNSSNHGKKRKGNMLLEEDAKCCKSSSVSVLVELLPEILAAVVEQPCWTQ